tara:strand:- start:2569 stop:2718 length:150 start_codon:yes stop_codon:yes gene_type:complete
MPVNIVKTKRDEKLWSKAKYAAGKRGSNKNYALVNHIYQRMKAAKKKVT